MHRCLAAGNGPSITNSSMTEVSSRSGEQSWNRTSDSAGGQSAVLTARGIHTGDRAIFGPAEQRRHSQGTSKRPCSRVLVPCALVSPSLSLSPSPAPSAARPPPGRRSSGVRRGRGRRAATGYREWMNNYDTELAAIPARLAPGPRLREIPRSLQPHDPVERETRPTGENRHRQTEGRRPERLSPDCQPQNRAEPGCISTRVAHDDRPRSSSQCVPRTSPESQPRLSRPLLSPP